MRVLFACLVVLVVGCSPYQEPPQKTDTCFDYESCHRACYLLDNKKACKVMGHYKQK